jgi:hypothetical protein
MVRNPGIFVMIVFSRFPGQPFDRLRAVNASNGPENDGWGIPTSGFCLLTSLIFGFEPSSYTR